MRYILSAVIVVAIYVPVFAQDKELIHQQRIARIELAGKCNARVLYLERMSQQSVRRRDSRAARDWKFAQLGKVGLLVHGLGDIYEGMTKKEIINKIDSMLIKCQK